MQLDGHWYVREPGYKLNEAGELFDMSDAPFTEKLVPRAADTDLSKAARQRLAAALAELNPAGGKTDRGGAKPRGAGDLVAGAKGATGPWKSGDQLMADQAPSIAATPLAISAEIDAEGDSGVIVTQGGPQAGYAIYFTGGKLAFAIRENRTMTAITAKEALGKGHFAIEATLKKDGTMTLSVDGKQVAEGKAEGLLPRQPRAGFFVGTASLAAVGEYTPPNPFKGKVSNVRVKTGSAEPR